jgi:hypothetical protein
MQVGDHEGLLCGQPKGAGRPHDGFKAVNGHGKAAAGTGCEASLFEACSVQVMASAISSSAASASIISAASPPTRS